MDTKNDYVMYIFINNSLQMSKGKIASQVGHIVQKIIEDIYDNQSLNKKKIDIFNRYKNWRNGSKKIILKATHTELLDLQQESESVSIYDAGHTQIAPNSLTCIGFYPSSNNEEKFKNFKLL